MHHQVHAHRAGSSAPLGHGFWGALALATLAGAILRLWHLDRQVLGGDELHLVRAALDLPWGEILTTYHAADNCIPLTALNRLLLELGVPLSERLLRFPMLAAGIAAPPILGIALARRLGGVAGAYFAWLLALSPQLVFYSLIARPYMPAVLLAAIGAFACDAVARNAGRPLAFLYGTSAALAAWLLPPALALAAAPPVAGLAVARFGTDTDRRASFRRLFAAAAICAGIGLALIGPALPSLLELGRTKRTVQSVSLATWSEVAGLAVGVGSHPLAAAVWAGALAGLGCLLHRDRGFALFSLALVAIQVISIRLLSPIGLGNPVILGRYLLPALPFELLWLAAGLAELWRLSPRQFRPAIALLPLTGLFLAGPFARGEIARSSFFVHDYVLRFTLPLPEIEPSPCYRRLADFPRGAVFETPWMTYRATRVAAAAQRVHRRTVRLGVYDGPTSDPRLAWRTLFSPEPEGALRSGAAVAVLHADPAAEDAKVHWSGDPQRLVALPGDYLSTVADLSALRDRYRQVLGSPVCSDESVTVWDLTHLHPAGL